MSTRLSMGSDGEGGRRSTNLYRTGGAAMGGVEPLFDYPGEHHVQMERFAERDEDDESEDRDDERWRSDEERRSMLKGGGENGRTGGHGVSESR